MSGGRFVVAVAAAFICAAYGSFAAPVRIDAKAGESLVAVRDRVRALPASEKANGVEVVLAEGEYLVLDGLELTVADSGASAAAPVVWRSEKPGAARIVGSRRIPASLFKKVANPQFLARIPEEGRGKVYAADVSALCTDAAADLPDSFLGAPPPPFVFFDGNLGSMARWPNGGEWASFTNRVDKGLRGGGAFVFDDPRASRWDFAKGVWLNGYFTHDWDNRCVRALSYGTENGTNRVLRLRGDTKFGVMAGTWGRRERRFRVFNVLEELDEEGEWYLDRERKVLFVVPPGGAMKDDAEIRIALSEKPLLSGRGVKNLRFDGIGFCCAYGGFARLEDLEDVTFSGCLFSGAVKDGIKVECGTRVRFDGCDCGDEVYGNVFLNVPRGIMIGGGREHPVRNNVFINCNLGLSIDCRGIRWKHWNKPGDGWHLEGKAQKFDYTEGLWAERYPRLASIMNDHPREPLYNPVEGNTFIDCGAIIDVREMFTYNDRPQW